MIRLNFNLKTPKQDTSLIIIKSSIGKSRFVMSTGITIPAKFWNPATQKIREHAEFDKGTQYQLQLNRFEIAFQRANNYFMQTNQSPTVLAFKDMVKKNLEGNHIQASLPQNMSFNKYLDSFIQKRAASPKYKPESIKVYKTLRVHFLRYVQRSTIHFEDLTIDFLEGFTNYLQNQDYSDNHVNKIFSTMKTVLNEATDAQINTNMAYKSRRLCIAKREADNIYLSLKEIKKMYQLKLEAISEVTRDLFIIGCSTGLRYSDFSSLTKGNIVTLQNGSKALRIVTAKTNDMVVIPLNSMVLDLLAKYEYKLPKGPANQTMNKELKVIAQNAGIDDEVLKRVFRSNNAVTTKHKKYELVSTHTARRSFATNAYKSNIPVPSIMKITGHKKHETFMKYLCLDNDEHAVLMSANPFFE